MEPDNLAQLTFENKHSIRNTLTISLINYNRRGIPKIPIFRIYAIILKRIWRNLLNVQF